MLILGPFLVPFIMALLCAFPNGRVRPVINLAGGALLLACSITLLITVAESGRQSLALGAWPLPYAIEFAVDGLSAAMLTLVALVNLFILLYEVNWREAFSKPGLYPLQHGLVAATMAVILSADLFNLYVWFELMLIAMLGLLVLGGKPANHEAAFKYFALSMLGTLLMLAAVGLIYGATGHLNYSALAAQAAGSIQGQDLSPYVGLLLVALLLKAGVFPVFAWLPAAYHTLPAPLLALVGGLLTKITLYIMLRLTGQVFDAGIFYEALGWLAVVTMVSGVLGAAYHWDLRRILAFHIVSQIGYLLLGLALSSEEASVATSFFLFHNVLVKTNLFLIAGLMWQSMGHYDLRRGGGLLPGRRLLAALFLLSALSLVGVPPTSGFWGKFLLLDEAFSQQRYIWAGVALATGLLTLYSMTKIWLEGFWKPHPQSVIAIRASAISYAAVVMLSLVILLTGLYPEPLIHYLQNHPVEHWGVGH